MQRRKCSSVPIARAPKPVTLRLTILVVSSIALVHQTAAGEIAFQHRYVDRNLPDDSYGQSSLVDVDRDGDLDFITGGKDPETTVYWFEFQAPDHWKRHALGA